MVMHALQGELPQYLFNQGVWLPLGLTTRCAAYLELVGRRESAPSREAVQCQARNRSQYEADVPIEKYHQFRDLACKAHLLPPPIDHVKVCLRETRAHPERPGSTA